MTRGPRSAMFADWAGELRRHAAALVDLALPPMCPVCGERLTATDQGVCDGCWDRVQEPRRPHCGRCGLGEHRIGRACSGCLRTEIHWDIARQAAVWEEPAPSMVHALKYRSVAELAGPMARLLARLLAREFRGESWDLVVPVPLHRVRERERGYNQSALIARRLAAMHGWRFDGETVIRARATQSQTRLTRVERLKNVRGAFRCVAPERVAGRRVLLIDDVHTTGSTLNETSAALREAGARWISALAVTRADA